MKRIRIILVLLTAGVTSACFSNRPYPDEWPVIDTSRPSLDGTYVASGSTNYARAPTSTYLMTALFGEAGAVYPQHEPTEPEPTVEIIDHGERIEAILRVGEREVTRRVLVKDTSDWSWFGLWNQVATWEEDDGELTKRDTTLFVTVIANGYGRDKFRFHKAVDGSIVLEIKRQGYAFIFYLPIWLEVSRFWTRWEPVSDGKATGISK